MLKIFEQREPETKKPFRIIETVETIDGPRDRITDFCFETIWQARFFLCVQDKDYKK